MCMHKMIGTVNDFEGIIAVSNEIGVPICNFFSYKDFIKWLNKNKYSFVGNAVIQEKEVYN